MKRIITLTLLLVFSLTWPASGEMKIPDPPRQFYCLDEAQMLTPELEAALVNTSAQIADKSGAQIEVVTLETLNAGRILDEHLVPNLQRDNYSL